MLVERLELYLDVGRLHDLVDLAILLATDELAVLVSELDLEAYLVMIGLRKQDSIPKSLTTRKQIIP